MLRVKMNMMSSTICYIFIFSYPSQGRGKVCIYTTLPRSREVQRFLEQLKVLYFSPSTVRRDFRSEFPEGKTLFTSSTLLM